MNDATKNSDTVHASRAQAATATDTCEVHGHYELICRRVKPHMAARFEKLSHLRAAIKSIDLAGRLESILDRMRYTAWASEIDNLVTTEGKNALLTNGLKGAGYTAAVYMGLISSVSYTSQPVVDDTMASHATWTEAGGTNAPTFAARLAVTFGTASAGSLATSASSNFTMTGDGTIKGAFICFNGANATIGNTTGTLYAAGLFSADKIVVVNDVIQVSYTTRLT